MKTALLIIDMQNDYFPGGSMELVEPEKAGEKAQKLLEHFRAASQPVVHIQHIAINPGATFFLPDTAGAEIHHCVKPAKGEKIVRKHFPNSFLETDLLEYLKAENITDLVISGMMTHMCVDATTRAAKDLGFQLILIGDACATRDLSFNGVNVKAEDVHHAFLASLQGTYAKVMHLDQYLQQ